jgi:hypothetical protein
MAARLTKSTKAKCHVDETRSPERGWTALGPERQRRTPGGLSRGLTAARRRGPAPRGHEERPFPDGLAGEDWSDDQNLWAL